MISVKYYAFALILVFTRIYSQTIQINVDKNFVQEGEFISLKIEADGANDFPLADLSPLDSDFEIISGPSQQTNFQWINGKMKNTKTLKWTLLPKKTGDIIIPPIVLKLGNKSISGKPISINVSASIGNSGKSIFIKADLDKSEAYLGEQISLSYKLYKQIDATISSIDQFDMPDFKGFWVEEIYSPQTLQYNSKTETIGGIKYQVANLGQKALFSIASSVLVIPEISVKIKIEKKQKKRNRDPFFDPFFSPFFTETKTKILKTEENKIYIKPFPEPRPLDFEGAVGKFKITSQVDTKTVEINNGFTFTISLNGTGNIGLFSLPEINFPDGLEVFPPSDRFTKDGFRNQLTGTQEWEYVIIPRKVGSVIIPSIKMSFFDPASSSWKSIKTKPSEIEVLNNNKKIYDNLGLTKKEVKLLGQDIRFIITDMNNSFLSKIINTKAILILYISSVIIFILPMVLSRLGNYNMSNLQIRKKRGALKNSIKLLKADGEDPFDIASNSLYQYLKDKFTLPSSNLDPIEVQKILAKRISKASLSEVAQILKECDAGRFSHEKKSDKKLILHNMKNILIRLDQELA